MTAPGPDIERMLRRQKVLADFGDFALRSEDLEEVLTEACRLVSEALGTARAKVLEIEEGGEGLLVRAGVGWSPGIVGQMRVHMREHSPESYSIGAGVPVITADIGRDDRFDMASFMKKEGVVALVNVPIFLPGGTAYGLLQVDHTAPRDFQEEDSEFLRTYATILGPVIDRLLKIERLQSAEERFRAFVTASSDVVYRMSPDWTEMRELDGRGFLADMPRPSGSWKERYLHPDDRPKVEAAIDRAVRTQGFFELEYRVRRADGRLAWVLSHAAPIKDGQGQIIEWLGTVRDVTARREAEEALRVSEERLGAVFEALPVGVGVADAQGAMILSNPEMQRFLPTSVLPSRDGARRSRWRGRQPDGQPVEPEDFPGARALRGERVVPGMVMLYTGDDGLEIWTNVTAVPLRDAEGRIVGQVAAVNDIDAVKRTAEALRVSEERFRAIVETATDYAILTTDAEGRIETWPAGAQAVFGWSAEEAVGQPIDITFTPEDRAAGEPGKERRKARETGHSPDVRWHLRKDGSRAFIDGVTRLLTGPDGQLRGFVKVGQDVTERRATQEALRESEARFRQFGDASADVLWIRNAETLEFEYVSPAIEEIYGLTLEHILGGHQVRRWAEMIVPEDRAKAIDALRRVGEGEHVLHVFRILRSDGQVRWIRDTSFPLLDEKGGVQRLGGIAHDVTEQVEMQDRLRVLVAELQHRSRNLVGVMQGVTERTLATSATLDDFRTRIRARLAALGRVNGLLSRLEEGDRISFDQLLQTELQAHGVLGFDGRGEQVTLTGPTGIHLRSATVQTFALALHELATNALKHGALSRPGGRLDVKWGLVPGKGSEQRLRVDWRETGVAVPDTETTADSAPPGRQGYGRELIERALPYQLKAQTSYELTPEGVRCTIIVPVSSMPDVALDPAASPRHR